jgi:protein-S-isoprenylcysteine O-methyltransferase
VRHPSYAGFFLTCLGIDLFTVQPLNTLCCLFELWRFYKARVAIEERFLTEFFGKQYVAYASRTWSGLPLID